MFIYKTLRISSPPQGTPERQGIAGKPGSQRTNVIRFVFCSQIMQPFICLKTVLKYFYSLLVSQGAVHDQGPSGHNSDKAILTYLM